MLLKWFAIVWKNVKTRKRQEILTKQISVFIKQKYFFTTVIDTYGVQGKYEGPLIVCLCTKYVTKLL
jgi:hypothetical protein